MFSKLKRVKEGRFLELDDNDEFAKKYNLIENFEGRKGAGTTHQLDGALKNNMIVRKINSHKDDMIKNGSIGRIIGSVPDETRRNGIAYCVIWDCQNDMNTFTFDKSIEEILIN